MENERRLIDANVLKAHVNGISTHWLNDWSTLGVLAAVDRQPTVDAVEVETLRAWLYKIAMNNTKNYLCDACKEIISRLDGLRAFARERKEDVNA